MPCSARDSDAYPRCARRFTFLPTAQPSRFTFTNRLAAGRSPEQRFSLLGSSAAFVPARARWLLRNAPTGGHPTGCGGGRWCACSRAAFSCLEARLQGCTPPPSHGSLPPLPLSEEMPSLSSRPLLRPLPCILLPSLACSGFSLSLGAAEELFMAGL